MGASMGIGGGGGGASQKTSTTQAMNWLNHLNDAKSPGPGFNPPPSLTDPRIGSMGTSSSSRGGLGSVLDNPNAVAETGQVGLCISGTAALWAGVGGQIGFGYAWDDHGQGRLYFYAGGGGAIGTPGFSVTGQFSESNAPKVDDLAGWFANISVGGGAGLDGAFDAYEGQDSNGNIIIGQGGSVGLGAGGSASTGPTYTWLASPSGVWNWLRHNILYGEHGAY
jgi:hypothetical protein